MQQFPASDTPQVYHISLLYQRVVSDGTFPTLWMSFPWTWGFRDCSYVCWLSHHCSDGNPQFFDFHWGWPCGKASAPVLWWRSRFAWFSRLPVESWRNGDAKNGIRMVLRANQTWRIFCRTGDITNYGSVRRIRFWNKQQVGMNCPKGIAYWQKKC